MTRSLIILLLIGGTALADDIKLFVTSDLAVSIPLKKYEMVANQEIFRLGEGGCLIGPLEIGPGIFKLEAGFDFPTGCSKK